MAKSTTSNNRVKASSWGKNVGKSLGLAAKQALEDMAPITIKTAESFNDVYKEVKDAIKSSSVNSADAKSGISNALRSKVDIGKTALKNARADIRSGNLYNNTRVEESIMAEFGFDDFDDMDFDMGDMEFSDNFDDDSFDSDSSSSSTKVIVPNVTVNANIDKNNPMVQAVATQTSVLVETSQASLAQDAVIAKGTIQMVKDVGSSLYEGISAINTNLGKMLNFQSSVMTDYITSSMNYHEQSLKIMTEFIELYKTRSSMPDSGYGREAYTQDAVSLMDGQFNLKEYANLVKKQLKGEMSSNFYLSSLGLISSDESLKQMAMEPLNGLMTGLVKGVIPKMLQERLTEFDKSLKAFFPALGMKIFGLSDGSNNEILQAIGRIFGIKTENKKTVDTSKYEKGPMPFNGITQKSIVEVIPGYLSRILSAITGEPAKLYDAEAGEFRSISKIKSEFNDSVRNRTRYNYEYEDKIRKAAIDGSGAKDQKTKDSISKKIDSLLTYITDSNQMINIFKDNGRELETLLNKIGATGGERAAIKKAIMSLDRSEIMRTFGLDAMNARTDRSNLYYAAESKSNSALNSLFNGLFSREELAGASGATVKHKSSLFSQEDEHGYTPNHYLRSIYKTLLEGINVHIVKKAFSRKSLLDSLNSEKSVTSTQSTSSTAELEDDAVLAALDEKEAEARIKAEKEKNKEEKDRAPGKFSKMLPKSLRESYNKMRDTILDGPVRMITRMIDKLDNSMFNIIFGKPEEGDTEKTPFLTRIFNTVTGKFESFFKGIETKFLEPLNEAIFGEDGLITKFKQSETWAKLKGQIKKGTDYLFGAKDEEGIRRNGLFSETGMAISDMSKSLKYYFTGQEYKDSKGNIHPKNPDSVFGEVRNIFKGFKSTMKEYLFGDKDADTKEKAKGMLSGITSSLKEGFQNFADAIFGPKEINGKKNSNYIAMNELTSKIKERMPKSLATGIFGAGAGMMLGGKLGLLGSLLLPGGPIGGAIIGTTVGFLSQSDRFKNWLFGEKDEETQERVGGIISKSTQEFFKKHKTGLIGGATLGTVKGALGIGILPGLFGGPIAGAVMGIGSSLLLRSEKFQNLMFGEEDENGQRTGGFFNKIMGKAKSEDAKKRAGTIGAGALGGLGIGTVLSQFGLLGAFSFGPLSGAIAGAVAGISLTSDKWKKALFGEVDVDDETGATFRKGGLLTRFSNLLSVEVLQPLKVGLLETTFKFDQWWAKNIEEPVLDSIEPFKKEIEDIKKNIHEAFVTIREKIENSTLVQGAKKYLFQPIIEGFRDHVFEPFKRLTNFLMGGAGKIIGGIAKTPFKALEFVANKLAKRQEKRGISSYKDKIIQNIKDTPTIKVISEGIDWIKEKTTNLTKSFLSTLGDGVKMIVKGAFKTLSTVIAAPFKMIAAPFKAIGELSGLRKIIKNRKNKDVQDQSLLDQISGGNRGFFQSIGDLVRISLPGSQLRHDARYSSDGAGYQSERDKQREKRATERATKKKQQDDLIKDMRSRLAKNQDFAKQLGYDTVDADGKLMNGIYKDIDKQMEVLYGKDYKKATKYERNRFKEDQIQKMNISSISDNTKSTSDKLRAIFEYLTKKLNKPLQTVNVDKSSDAVLTKGDTIRDASIKGKTITARLAQAMKAAEDANEAEEEQDAILKKRHADVTDRTASNLQAANALKAEQEKESKWKDTLLGAILSGNKTREEHKTGWDSIFSKKGLIGSALLLALPLLTKFLKDPSAFGQMIGEWISKIDFSGIGSAIVDAIKKALGLDDGDSENRTDAAGDTNSSDYSKEAIADVGIYGARKGARLAKDIYPKFRTLTTVRKSITQLRKQLKARGYTKKQIAEILDNAEKAGTRVAKDLGSADEITEAMMKSVSESTGAVGDAVVNTADNVVGAAAKSADNVVDSIKSGKKFTVKTKSLDNVGDAIIKIDDDAVSVIGKGTSKSKIASEVAGNAITDVGDDALEVAAKSSDGIITKFIKYAKEAVSTLKSKAMKKFPSIKSSVFSKIDDVLTKILKPAKLGKYVGKIASTITKVLSSTTFAVAFFVYGVGTGATKTEAAHLFKVPIDSVDGTMQLISGFFKALLNTGPMVFVDLINIISSELLGINFVAMFATAIYSGIKHDDEVALDNFAKAQTQFGQDYNDYTLAQQIAKGNVEYDADGNIVTDEKGNAVFKDQSLVEGENSYNDRLNKSVMGRAWDSIKESGFNFKSKYFGNEGDSEKLAELKARKKALKEAAANNLIDPKSEGYKLSMKNLNKEIKKNTKTEGKLTGTINKVKTFASETGAKIKDTYINTKEGVKIFVGDAKDSVKSFFNSIGEGFNNIIGSIKKSLSTFGSNAKDSINDIMSGVSTVFSSEYWKLPSEDDELGKFSNILFYTKKVLSLPITGTLSVVKKISDGISKVVNVVSPILKFVGASTKDSFTDIASGNTVFTKEYWTLPTKNSTNENVGGLGAILFYANRFMTLPSRTVLSLAYYAYTGIKNIVKGLSSSISKMWSMTKTDVSNIISGDAKIFSQEYWTPPSESDPESGISNVLFYSQKILSLPITGIVSIGKRLYNGAKNVVNGIKTTVSTMWSLTKDGMSQIISGGSNVFSSDYWTPPSEGNPESSISNVLFYAQRILTLPIATTLNIGKKVYEGAKNIVNGIKTTVSTMWSLTKTDISNIVSGDAKIFSSEYWTPPSVEDPTSSISNTLFYAQKILSLPVTGTISISKSVYEGAKNIVNGIKTTVSTMWSLTKDGMSQILSGDASVMSSEYWIPPSAEDPTSSISNTLFYAQRILTLPVASVLTVGRTVYDKVTPIITKISDSVSQMWSVTKEDFSKLASGDATVFSSEYWTPPSSESGSEIGAGLFYAQRVLTVLPAAVTSIGRMGVGGIKSIIGKVSDLGSLIKDYGNVTEDDLGESYFTFPGSSNDTSLSGGVQQTAFYITRATMYPVLMIKKLFSGITDWIKDATDWIKSKIKGIADWFDFDTLKNEDYSFNNQGDGNDPSTPGIGGPLDLYNEYKQTSGYGYRSLGNKFHGGVDLTKGLDSPIKSFFGGKVVRVVNKYAPNSGKYPSNTGYGNHVGIKDDRGYTHIYGHMNKVNSDIKEGTVVKSGQVIGTQGHTGNSTGTHLHYQINKNGFDYNSNVDPVKYIKQYNNSPGGVYSGLDSTTLDTTPAPAGLSAITSSLSSAITDSLSPLNTLTSSLSEVLNPIISGSDNYTSESNAPYTTYIDPKLGYKQFLHQNLQSYNPITEAELNSWIKAKGNAKGNFIGNGKVFLDASKATGLDPRYIVAHAAVESGWGTSSISKNKNNYFGIGAFDSSPYASAYTFNSGLASGIIDGAKWIDKNYTEKGQDTLYKMRFNNGVHQYATDPEWANKIAKIMATAPQAGAGDGPSPDYSSIDTFKTNNKSTRTNDKKLDGKDHNTQFFEQMVKVLIEIAENTGSSSESLEELKSTMKEKSDSGNNVNVTSNKNVNTYNKASEQKARRNQKEYQTAKAIARGTSA